MILIVSVIVRVTVTVKKKVKKKIFTLNKKYFYKHTEFTLN